MILYQKSKTPFILRLLPVLFHPGMLLVIGVMVALGYFAWHETSSIVIGIYISMAVVALILWFGYSALLSRIIHKIILIEIVPSGLHIQQLTFNQLIDVVIPAADLVVEATTYQPRRGGTNRYSLMLSNTNKPESVFLLYEEFRVIGELLEKIEAQNQFDLKANEKDFILRFKEFKNWSKSGWSKLVSTLFWVVPLLYLSYLGYQWRDYLKSLYKSFYAMNSPYVANWEVPNTSGKKIYLVFRTDSSLYETAFQQDGRWKITNDESQNLLLYNADNQFKSFKILSVNDSLLTLEGGIVFRKADNINNSELSDFAKVTGILDHSLPLPTPKAIQEEWLKKSIPEWQPEMQPSQLLFHSGDLLVYLLQNVDGSVGYAAAFNSQTQTLMSYEKFFHGEGCSHAFSQIKQGEFDLIQHIQQCEEGDADTTYFQFDKKGKAKSVEVHTATNTLLSNESFKNFPKKWFPLFDGANGVERQQLCGAEGAIEILENSGKFFWRESGFHDVWEGVLMEFNAGQGEGYLYKLKVQTDDSDVREILILENLNESGAVVTIDGKPYTHKPELFSVNNNTKECQ